MGMNKDTIKETIDFIEQYDRTYGEVPTMAEIAFHFGLTRQAIQIRLKRYREQGILSYQVRKKKAEVILD